MTFAPGAIFVNASGCLLDWLITRAWARVMLLAIPGTIALTLIVMSVWGTLLNKDILANWYLDLGEKELKKVDGDWAFVGSGQKSNASKKDSEESPSENSKSSNDSIGEEDESSIPRFAEAVFRRAQQLQPDNKRIVFVIAALLGKRGSFAQALALLKPYAPEEKENYPPAHALAANMILQQQPISLERQQILKHHLKVAPRWEQTPPVLLALAARIALDEKDYTRALALLKQAAQKSPMFLLDVVNVARDIGHAREAEEAAKKAEAYFRELIAKGDEKPTDRLALVQVIATRDASDATMNEATRILEEGLQKKESPELRRGLSELFRLKFSRTIQSETVDAKTVWKYDRLMLDQALQIDPTNPGIAEEIAKLVRLGGNEPDKSLIDKLEQNLVDGTTTPLTHVWLSEAHILRGEYAEAVKDLEKVIARMPNAAARYRNNLAYAMALAFPERIEQALEHARIAVAMEPRNADFRDTVGFLFLKLNRVAEAITQLEYAIEIAPYQTPPSEHVPEIHRRLAEAYKIEGNEEMAAKHLAKADSLSKTTVFNLEAASPTDETPLVTPNNSPPKSDTNTPENIPSNTPESVDRREPKSNQAATIAPAATPAKNALEPAPKKPNDTAQTKNSGPAQKKSVESANRPVEATKNDAGKPVATSSKE